MPCASHAQDPHQRPSAEDVLRRITAVMTDVAKAHGVQQEHEQHHEQQQQGDAAAALVGPGPAPPRQEPAGAVA